MCHFKVFGFRVSHLVFGIRKILECGLWLAWSSAFAAGPRSGLDRVTPWPRHQDDGT